MKQIVLMLLTLTTIFGYQIFKVSMATLGLTNFFIPVLVTLAVIVTCGIIHYFDEVKIK